MNSLPLADSCICGCYLQSAVRYAGMFSMCHGLLTVLFIIYQIEYTLKYMFWLRNAVGILLIPVSLLLFAATCMKSIAFLIPWLFVAMINIIINFIYMLFSIYMGVYTTFLITAATIVSLMYFIVLVSSYYRLVKRENSSEDDDDY